MLKSITNNFFPGVKVSVIIPTLGGNSLIPTIETLNRGSVVPDEIVICIPEKESNSVSHINLPNVKILVTRVRGQVAQRAEGFKVAEHFYVLQLDDDIIVDKHCLKNLLTVLKSNAGKYAVSPALSFLENGISVYNQWRNVYIRYLYYFLINGKDGFRPGNVSRAGTEIGVQPTNNRDKIEVDWLPGGCILHCKSNLILFNFYPHSGKAYLEDIYHSFYLHNLGVRFLIVFNAKVWIEDSRKEQLDFKSQLKNLLCDFKARKHFVKLASKSLGRMYLYYLITIMSRSVKFFLNLIR